MKIGECWVSISHKLNADGYLRKRITGTLEMFHRLVFRLHNGPIPEGHEVDHTCGVRSCSNPEHLRALPKSEHIVHTNRVRAKAQFWKVA